MEFYRQKMLKLTEVIRNGRPNGVIRASARDATANPANPMNPVNPDDAANPANPVNPTANPANPVNPVNPNDAANPANPVNPVNPDDANDATLMTRTGAMIDTRNGAGAGAGARREVTNDIGAIGAGAYGAGAGAGARREGADNVGAGAGAGRAGAGAGAARTAGAEINGARTRTDGATADQNGRNEVYSNLFSPPPTLGGGAAGRGEGGTEIEGGLDLLRVRVGESIGQRVRVPSGQISGQMESMRATSERVRVTIESEGVRVTEQDLRVRVPDGQTEGLVEHNRLNRRDPVDYLEKVLANWTGRNNVPEFSFKEITQQETSKLILRLGSSTSFGHDGIDAQILKIILPSISGPLTHAINVSLRDSVWANRWKIARIFPLLKDKSMDRMNPASYRPVSLLLTISKIVERAAQVQHLDFFEKSGQINPASHAYRAAHSTTTTITNIMDEIYQATDDKKISQLLTIDQSAAFDCLSHEILARKLRKYNVSVNTVKWIQNYLSFRTQYMTVGAVNSQMCQQHMGVPQGSVIGPLLYTIYVNELTDVVRDTKCREAAHRDKSKLFGNPCNNCGIINMYADDTTYNVSSRSRSTNVDKIETNLKKIRDF